MSDTVYMNKFVILHEVTYFETNILIRAELIGNLKQDYKICRKEDCETLHK